MKIRIIFIMSIVYFLNGCTKQVTVPLQSEEHIEQQDRVKLENVKASNKTTIEALRNRAEMIFSQEFDSINESSMYSDKPASETRFENVVSDFKKIKSTEG